MKLTQFAIVAALSSLFVAGCAASTSPVGETEGTTEEAVAKKADLRGTTWAATSGPIYSITFSATPAHTLGGFVKGHAFEATVDTGVRCITAPCPQSETTVSGVYAQSGTTLTLASYDKPTAVFGKYLGDYKATTKHGALTLHKKDGTVDGTFDAGAKCGNAVCGADTYCCNPLTSKCVAPGMFCTL